jgi:tRNA(adenine34) deaminase
MNDFDHMCMRRCIALSQESIDAGDAPFGTVIAKNGQIIIEARNDYKTKVSEHAEIVALNRAHTLLGSSDLSDCTLYTNVEPCPMCSFMIREFKVSRVVFSLPSPYVGGYTRWPILQDHTISGLTPYFSTPPEIIKGFLENEARAVLATTPLWMFGSDITITNPPRDTRK